MTTSHGQERSGDETVVECELDASPEKVWRALTVPELAAEWLGIDREAAADAPRPSYEIVEAEPYRLLRYAWRDETAYPAETEVTFELWPRPNGHTWFRLTHGLPATARTPVAAANTNRPPLARAA
ncbi:SRPBCC domain-containing protein [Aquamicrobium sp. LC103]|uniref:SRPBCC family protein n=1 Tax=Aquamicrobium sp. LC103 TaxID=1120658 RepID=UPI00063EBF50|nr:SRPBCC domain-containing protein [Aquamicrobium sp. LC103]TKT76852.1 SRPBCC domain-containing protein [Aquamicrobium sp. LC103]